MVIRILSSLLVLPYVKSFSVPLDSDGSFALFDRFRSTCPADIGAIRLFDASLVEDHHAVDKKATWVAVYRSANNKPSVFVRDQFLSAMQSATASVHTDAPRSSAPTEGIEVQRDTILQMTEAPVAIARLTKSSDFDNRWVLDNMRCLLKKEETNPDCDGGSEHTEALSVAIDSVLIHHVMSNRQDENFVFDGAIRTKATLVSAPLLELRGFKEVTSLSRDMATHVCSLDACMESYAARAVTSSAKGPGARVRALQICSLLGQIDRERDLRLSAEIANDKNDDYDPWAGANRFLR
jgi:hypothetical protein